MENKKIFQSLFITFVMDQNQKLQLQNVLDGGFGREISRRGLPFKRPQWSALVIQEQPEAMIDIHSDYIKSGARIITTNTYAIVPMHIGEQKFKEKAHQMIKIACQMARRAKNLYPEQKVQIAFSVPPLSSYTPQVFLSDRKKAKEIYKHFLEPVSQMQFLDFYQCETLSTIEEAYFLMGQMQNLPKPYCLSFCVDRDTGDFRIQGQSWEQLAKMVQKFEKKPLAIMINCSPAEYISKNLQKMLQVFPSSIKIGCYPNFFSWVQEGKTYNPNESVGYLRQDMTPEVYYKLCKEWLSKGASIIGGCCEVGPEYMPSITKAFYPEQQK